MPQLAPLALLQLLDDGRPLSQVMVAAGSDDDTLRIVNTKATGLPQVVRDGLDAAQHTLQRVTLAPAPLRRIGAEAFGLDGPLGRADLGCARYR